MPCGRNCFTMSPFVFMLGYLELKTAWKRTGQRRICAKQNAHMVNMPHFEEEGRSFMETENFIKEKRLRQTEALFREERIANHERQRNVVAATDESRKRC
jgi:hypothetical protein